MTTQERSEIRTQAKRDPSLRGAYVRARVFGVVAALVIAAASMPLLVELLEMFGLGASTPLGATLLAAMSLSVAFAAGRWVSWSYLSEVLRARIEEAVQASRLPASSAERMKPTPSAG